MASDIMSYEQLEKLSKNPFYTLNKKELELLEKYRAERYQPPKRHSTKFNKNGYQPPKHDVKLPEEDDGQIS